MKKISLVLVAAMLLLSGNVLASDLDANKPSKSISTQIQKMLQNNSFDIEEGELYAQVRFTFNKDGEIVVLSVETEDNTLEGFVKGRLNYKKVDAQNTEEGKMYTVAVRVTA